jgi:hypothetical protein
MEAGGGKARRPVISDIWQSPRPYRTDPATRVINQGRRERNRAAGACINENNRGTHGKATHGCRCERCYVVHRGGRD